MTPEGRMKVKVKKVFAEYPVHLYAHWPVQNGMGSPTLDAICCFHGIYFAVETKAEGKDLTPRQHVTAGKMEAAGGIVFRVRDDAELAELAEWLTQRHARYLVGHPQC